MKQYRFFINQFLSKRSFPVKGDIILVHRDHLSFPVSFPSKISGVMELSDKSNQKHSFCVPSEIQCQPTNNCFIVPISYILRCFQNVRIPGSIFTSSFLNFLQKWWHLYWNFDYVKLEFTFQVEALIYKSTHSKAHSPWNYDYHIVLWDICWPVD